METRNQGTARRTLPKGITAQSTRRRGELDYRNPRAGGPDDAYDAYLLPCWTAHVSELATLVWAFVFALIWTLIGSFSKRPEPIVALVTLASAFVLVLLVTVRNCRRRSSRLVLRNGVVALEGPSSAFSVPARWINLVEETGVAGLKSVRIRFTIPRRVGEEKTHQHTLARGLNREQATFVETVVSDYQREHATPHGDEQREDETESNLAREPAKFLSTPVIDEASRQKVVLRWKESDSRGEPENSTSRIEILATLLCIAPLVTGLVFFRTFEMFVWGALPLGVSLIVLQQSLRTHPVKHKTEITRRPARRWARIMLRFESETRYQPTVWKVVAWSEHGGAPLVAQSSRFELAAYDYTCAARDSLPKNQSNKNSNGDIAEAKSPWTDPS